MIDNEKIKQDVLDGNVTITAVIDAVIEINGFVGVGLITLGNDLQDYCYGYSEMTHNKGRRDDRNA